MIQAPSGARSVTISVVVRDAHGNIIKDHGAVAHWHRNPLRRLMWKLGRLFK